MCKIVSVSHIWCTLQSSIPIGQLLLEGQVVQNCRSQNWKKRNPDQRKKIGEFSNQVLYSFIVRFAFWVILTGIFMHFQLNFFSLILRGFCLIIRKQIWSHNFDGVQLDHQHSPSPCLTTHDPCHLPLCTDPVKKNAYIYLYTFIFVICILLKHWSKNMNVGWTLLRIMWMIVYVNVRIRGWMNYLFLLPYFVCVCLLSLLLFHMLQT